MTVRTSGPLFDSSKQNVTREIRQAAKVAAGYADFRVRARSAVRTGQMRAGWKTRLVGNGLNLTNDVPWTIYNELGTRKMAARPMARPTLVEAQAVFKLELAKLVSRKFANSVARSGGTVPTKVSGNDSAAFSALTNGAASVGRRGFRSLKPSSLSYGKIKGFEKRFGKARPSPPGKIQSRLAARAQAAFRSTQ